MGKNKKNGLTMDEVYASLNSPKVLESLAALQKETDAHPARQLNNIAQKPFITNDFYLPGSIYIFHQ
jgi:hypothetical protein